jgi:hypothetical protein
MRSVKFSAVVMGAILLFWGCGPKILLPPRVDLRPYGTLGMIELSSNAKGNLAQYTSQKILHSLQEAQPGTAVVELGTLQKALGSVGYSELDVEAIKAIGSKYGVGGIITGNLEVEKVKPSIDIASTLKNMSVSAYVEAMLLARLVETKSGATVWSNSAQARENVASVSLLGGDTYFNAKDPDKAYGQLVRHLVGYICNDFWSHYK